MKRIISLVIIAALLFVYAPIISLSASGTEEMSGLLTAINVIDGKMLNRTNVTRSEFAMYLSKLMNSGMDETSLAPDDPFADVYKSEPGSGALYHLKNLGIIRGSGQNMFNGDDYITVEQAYIIALRALGYTNRMDNVNSSQSSVLFYAQSTGITVDIGNTELLTSEGCVRILFQMLRVEDFTSPDVSEYNISISEKNFMEYYWGIRVISGVVRSNAVTSIFYGEQTTAIGRVLIDGVHYNDINKYTAELLGFSVTAYVDRDDNIVYACADDFDEFVIDSSQNPQFGNLYVTYDKNDISRASLKLEKGYSLVYNGKASNDPSKIIPSDGSIRLLDNDNNGLYDVVFTEQYNYIFVSSVSADGIVLDVNNNMKLDLSEDNDKIIEIYNSNSKVMSVEDINVGMLLRCVVDSEENYIKIYVSSNKIDGTITSVTDNKSVFIDDTEYEYNSYYTKYYSNIAAGETGTFYFDDKGRLTVFVIGESQPELNFGYIMSAKRAGMSGDEFKLRIMTEKGEAQSFDLGEFCRIDGVRYNTYDTSLDSKFLNGEKIIYQLVRYLTDSNGKITVIDTIHSNNDYDMFENPNNSEDMLKNAIEKGSRRYRSLGVFLPTSATDGFRVDGNAVIFIIPENADTPSLPGTYSEDEFGITSSLVNAQSYTVEAYNMDKTGKVEAILIYDSLDPNIVTGSTYGIVYKVTTILDDNGETTRNIVYYDGTSFKDLPLSQRVNDKITSDNISIKPGDFIRFNSAAGYGTAIKVEYSHTRGSKFTASYGIDASFEIRKFYPQHIKDGYMIANDDNGRQFVYDISAAQFAEVTEGRFTLKASDISYVKSGADFGGDASEIVMVMSYSQPKFIVIYNK